MNYSKNKLMAKYVTVPLQLHFATKPNKKGDMLAKTEVQLIKAK